MDISIINEVFSTLEEKSMNVVSNFEFNLSKISTGRANPQLIKNIKVSYYEELIPLEQISNISVPEPQQLLIKPFDHNITKEIHKSLLLANLDVAIVNEGNQIRLNFPALNTQRRKELVKSLNKFTEQARVSIRLLRQESNKKIKSFKNEISEDDIKKYETKIQTINDSYIEQIDEITKRKERELMEI
ncbi:ribosome recycling factor [Mycoplasmopsis pulmonis]|uniref:ribosome recycling factor n=1 Tax=Mycoplasmopsis pulmonis TaxID=2107 RepID=UPI002ACD5C40|nr:ribosome recycling factor [Mycoplasmopsis pulmonis]MDZ7293182.1 ribosome recycling factor [Mycoplasmopsis pulmonis]